MQRRYGFCSFFLLAGVAVWGAGCGDLLPCEQTPGCRVVFDSTGGLDALVIGAGIGESCASEPCRSGLSCEKDRCAPSHGQALGQRCVVGDECESGLICVPGPCPIGGVPLCPVCSAAGPGAPGDACRSDLDCASGGKCALSGFSAECTSAGSSDFGQQCQAQTDCLQGLFCNDGSCSLEPPLFQGVSCDEPDDDHVEALFAIPGAATTANDVDYFQFPFPNDFRLGADGRPDLGDFPRPGPGLLGVDIVQRYIDAIEAHGEGWSTNPTIIFRFSGSIDLDSFQGPEQGFFGVDIIDVDNLPADPEQGVRHHSTSYAVASRSNYVCDNWFAIRSPRNTLVPGHRYVVLLVHGKSAQGQAIARTPEFDAMLESATPKDPAVAKAHAAYAPLRELIAFYKGSTYELDPAEITAATVLTTGDVQQPMRTLAADAQASDMPHASDWVKCGPGQESPCPQADEGQGRACGQGTDDYDEYQALLEIPIFQQGQAPYLDEGGGIADAPTRKEKICLSLAVPKTTMPVSGWPLVIYGHGTGGSYRSELRASIAGRLTNEVTPAAVLGFDEVEHGPRRGTGNGADKDPEDLFFNFVNPDAARGNPLQGAADVLSVLRFAKQGLLATSNDTGADPIQIDTDKIVIYGHSQGATHSSLALPFSGAPGGVLSGNGGGIVEALLGKTKPVNIAGAIPFVIQDADDSGQLRMGDKHPVLALLQQYIDPADPINFAALLAARPEPEQGLKSVLQTFGLDDSYAPPATLARYIYAAERMVLAPAPTGLVVKGDNVVGVAQSQEPVSGNVTVAEQAATLVCRQYEGKTDGHFVADEVAPANDDVVGFLSTLLADDLPTVPVP